MSQSIANDVDVLIIGAGPAGLCAALQLAVRGHRVRVLDKAASGSQLSRAGVVWERSQRDFARLGLLERLQSFGVPFDRVVVRDAGGQIASVVFPHPFGLAVSQAFTEQTLREGLAKFNVSVEWRTTVSALLGADGTALTSRAAANATATQECVLVKIVDANGTSATIRAKFVIAADGAHSFVRHTLNLKFNGHRVDTAVIIAADVDIASHEAFDRASMHVFLPNASYGTEHVVMIARLGVDTARRRVFVPLPVPPGASDDALRTPPDDAALVRVIESSAVSSALSQPIKITNVAWKSSFVLHERLIESHVAGRIAFVGDAAHCHSPVGGQGMNLGLQDGPAIAWRLSLLLRNPKFKLDTLMQSYHAERSPIARMIVNATDRANIALSQGFPASTTLGALAMRLAHWSRNQVFWTLTRSSWFVGQLGLTVSQLEHTYAACTDSATLGPDARPAGWTEWLPLLGYRRSGPYPGDLAPMLLDAQAPAPHDFVLVSLSTPLDVDKRHAAYCSSRGVAASDASAFGLDADSVKLIRPDGHVALCSDRASAAKVIDAYFSELQSSSFDE